MNTPKPRRWFQLHLSTGIVLMFVAGGLMWLNNIPGMFERVDLRDETGKTARVYYSHNEKLPEIGWPVHIYEIGALEGSKGDWIIIYYLENMGLRASMDIVVNILILLMAAFAMEWRIRRKQPLPTPEPQ